MKNFKYVLIAAILVSASCQRDQMNDDVRIDATFVAKNEGRTKTSLVSDNVLWDSGDQIRILWDGYYVLSECHKPNHSTGSWRFQTDSSG